MKNIERNFQKKAAKFIRLIQAATNMVDIRYIFNDAHLDVFKLRNLGLLKAAMNKAGKTEQEYMNIKAHRTADAVFYGEALKVFLSKYIPQHCRKSKMYKDLCNELCPYEIQQFS